MAVDDFESSTGYSWRDEFYPKFYPVPDITAGCEGTYYVEFALTCYPYAKSSSFDTMAYPPELRCMLHDPLDIPTRFFFAAPDGKGGVYEKLSFTEACRAADFLNDSYHDLIDECIETWEWDRMPFELSTQDLVATK